MKKVLIVDKMHESIEPLLKEAGFQADYRPDITKAEVDNIIGEYYGLMVRSKLTVDAELIDRATNLTFVARAGAGLDKVDHAYLESRGIVLINAPEGNRNALGEHTLGMLLSLLHKLHSADLEVKKGVWNREGNRGYELRGRTVGIYGCGFMGSAFAEKLRGMDCEVLVYDKYKTNLTNDYQRQVDLKEFMDKVQILSLHVPLTSETKYLFEGKYLRQFSKLEIILNTSRGEVLDLKAVDDLLDESLLAAGLDVLENEKLSKLTPDQQDTLRKLSARSNVLLTPHVAGWTYESYERINEVIVSKLKHMGLVQMSEL